MNNRSTLRPQFNLATLLLMMLMFALGIAARDFISRWNPAPAPVATNTLPASTSPLKPGDVLIVQSATAEDLNRRVTVLADLTISMPLIGDYAVGKKTTVRGLERSLNTKYAPYYRAPAIQVHREIASQPLD